MPAGLTTTPEPSRSPLSLRRALVFGCLLTVALVALIRQSQGLHASLLGWEDRLLRLTRAVLPEAAPSSLVVVTLDEATARRVGPPPWPRDIYARFLAQLCRLQPRVVGLDLVFVGHDSQDTGDAALAQAMRACGNVLLTSHVDAFGRYVEPLPILASAAQGYGVVNKPRGADFVVRRGRAWMADAQGQLIDDAFEVKVAAAMLGVPLRQIQHAGRTVTLRGSRGAVTIQALPDGTIPIRYAYQPSELPTLDFVDVLDGRVGSGAVRDKLVLVGWTYRDRDVHRTPLGMMSGLGIIANTTLMFLSGRSLIELHDALELLLVFVLALLTIILTYRLPAWQSGAAVAGVAAGCGATHLVLWRLGVLWHWSLPVGLMGLLYCSTSLHRSVLLRRETAAARRDE